MKLNRKRAGRRSRRAARRRVVKAPKKKVAKALTLDAIEHIYESNIDC